ncbi:MULTISPECIES: alpha-amylase family glycosyl hydrolase [Clostridium]|uniref:alpha-amylase family glycosyl hydrolase n=1 Tax=Clostridium TaxID=1485 RepID=UPI00082424BD|nr:MULTISPECIES: alpha-amylase family glycosyl hydrolase [Clostridium]PJI10540.1 alpha-amylase [Clostridium sp. CT7]
MERKSLSKKLLASLIGVTLAAYGFVLPTSYEGMLLKNKSVVYADTINNLPSNTKDGTILQAFDWSFDTIKSELPNIKAAGFKTVQVSPVQGTKNGTKDANNWWILYQPTNQAIGNAQLGTYDDFKSLCSEAKQYGISIIVDVVMNHMANNGQADQLYDYIDPDFKDQALYHHNGQCSSPSDYTDRWKMTQCGTGEPDLNTQSPEVQRRAIRFLNQCVDAGASGFRFDSAKHIETNKGLDANKPWSGNYWDNVLGSLHNKSNEYICGEVLQDTNCNIDAYESFMDVTASSYGWNLRKAIHDDHNLGEVSTMDMGGLDPSKVVDFVETHDNYEHGESKLSDDQVKLGWGIIAGRAKSVPMFFDRPGAFIGAEGDNLWKNDDIKIVNKFHNAMTGQSEYLRVANNNQVMLIDRGNKGTVIVNIGGDTYINSATNLANGNYGNQGTANASFNVSNGMITGNLPGNSVIVLSSINLNNNNTSVVTCNPTAPVAGSTATITYDASGRNLQGSSNVTLHWGYDGWKGITNTTMKSIGYNKWQATIVVTSEALDKLNMCLTNGKLWDNNNSSNWNLQVR